MTVLHSHAALPIPLANPLPLHLKRFILFGKDLHFVCHFVLLSQDGNWSQCDLKNAFLSRIIE